MKQLYRWLFFFFITNFYTVSTFLEYSREITSMHYHYLCSATENRAYSNYSKLTTLCNLGKHKKHHRMHDTPKLEWVSTTRKQESEATMATGSSKLDLRLGKSNLTLFKVSDFTISSYSYVWCEHETWRLDLDVCVCDFVHWPEWLFE